MKQQQERHKASKEELPNAKDGDYRRLVQPVFPWSLSLTSGRFLGPSPHSLKNTCQFGDRIAPDDTWIQDTQPALLDAFSHPFTRTMTQMSLLVPLLESNMVTLSRVQQSSQADPGIQLLQVFLNPKGDSGCPHSAEGTWDHRVRLEEM